MRRTVEIEDLFDKLEAWERSYNNLLDGYREEKERTEQIIRSFQGSLDSANLSIDGYRQARLFAHEDLRSAKSFVNDLWMALSKSAKSTKANMDSYNNALYLLDQVIENFDNVERVMENVEREIPMDKDTA